jgi:hypothetical protein
VTVISAGERGERGRIGTEKMNNRINDEEETKKKGRGMRTKLGV